MTPTFKRLFLTALAVAQLVGCQHQDREQPPRRILLVTVDTLRADHLSAYGYQRPTSPAIDRLAAEGVRFDWAIAQWPLTGPSFASLMSGLYPRATGRVSRPHVPPPDGVTLLPEFLQQQGYRTLAVVSNRVLSREAGWDRGFDEYFETWAAANEFLKEPEVLKSWLAAPRVNELALPLLERNRDAEKLFVWLHYSDPHTPYTLPPDFTNPFSSDDPTPVPTKLTSSMQVKDLETVGEYVANYDANILIADRAIGDVLTRARTLGLLEDSVVIFAADHGESLGEHDYYFRHGRLPFNGSVRVPLVVVAPNRFTAGKVVEQPVELIDIYPTVRELVAPGEASSKLPGVSLLGTLRDGTRPKGFAVVECGKGNSRLLAVQTRDWKLVIRLDKGGVLDPVGFDRLFDLNADPLETRNVFAGRPVEAQALRARLDRWLSETHKGTESEEGEHDEEMRQALEALGYLD